MSLSKALGAMTAAQCTHGAGACAATLSTIVVLLPLYLYLSSPRPRHVSMDAGMHAGHSGTLDSGALFLAFPLSRGSRARAEHRAPSGPFGLKAAYGLRLTAHGAHALLSPSHLSQPAMPMAGACCV